MKLQSLWPIACLVAVLMPQGGSSQNAAPAPLHIYSVTDTRNVSLTADSIVREDPPTRGHLYPSLTRLKGHVEIRTCCLQLSTLRGLANSDPDSRVYMILHADEADYHEESGELEARGTVRVNFQDTRERR